MKKAIFFAITALLLSSACQHASEENRVHNFSEGEAEYAPTSTRKNAEEELNEVVIDRKLIKNARLAFETNNLSETHQRIISLSKKHKGYISADESQKGYNQVSNRLEIRLPADNFDAFISEVSNGVEHFDTRSIDVQDVTEQFVDLDARLNTKKALEKRFLELLGKAKNVTEILEIEKEISKLRSDIEVMEGRLRLMKNQIAFSTIQIEFYVQELEKTTGFGWKFSRGFKNGWENLLGFFVGLVNVWPFALILLTILIILRRRWKAKK